MPKVRKVSRAEALTWKNRKQNIHNKNLQPATPFKPSYEEYNDRHWTFRLFAEITKGDNEGIRRTRKGWSVSVHMNGGIPVAAEFEVSQYGSLAAALHAAVEARNIMREVVNGDVGNESP